MMTMITMIYEALSQVSENLKKTKTKLLEYKEQQNFLNTKMSSEHITGHSVSRLSYLFRSARTSWITFVRSLVGKKNLDQLYRSINHHRATANLSDIVWCMYGGVWSMSGGVWWCLILVWWCLLVSMYVG